MSLENLLQQMAERGQRELPASITHEAAAAHADALPALLAAKNTKHEFNSGDLITWKKHMQISKMPVEGGVAVFVRWLDEPVVASESGYPIRNHDFVMGVIDPDGDYLEFANDSSRFEPWVAPASLSVN